MEIQILPKNGDNVFFCSAIGEKTQELISRFCNKLDKDEVNRLVEEAVHILSHCVDPRRLEEQDTTHLAIGYVQSGKTMSFTTLSALAADNGCRIIIYFAGTKTNLLNQTTKRLRKDLLNNGKNNIQYKIYENPDEKNVTELRGHLRMKSKPTILITVLKHFGHISALARLFESKLIQQELGKQGVLIIDDEADQASLNGFAYVNSKNADSPEWDVESDSKESSTYSSILILRASLPNHSYVQYTAIPQAPLLISIADLLSPKTHTVLTPGKAYTGGKTFFKEIPDLIISIPDDEVFHMKYNPLTRPPKSFKQAVQLHILGVALNVYYWKNVDYLSMMIHADRQKDASRLFHEWATDLKERWSNIFNCPEDDIGRISLETEFEQVFKTETIKLYSKANDIPDFSVIRDHIPDVINDTKIALIISESDATKEVDWDTSTSHILVGADMLNRGFTVENLSTTYMPRYTRGKSTADTIQQRCRFFGYKLDYLKSCRVFLPDQSSVEYSNYVDHEEEMRGWLKSIDNLEDVERKLILSEKLNPTRRNILPVKLVQAKMRGWHQMNTFRYINHNIALVENFFANVDMQLWDIQYGTEDRNHKYIKLPITEAIELLSAYKFGNYPDTARKSATIRYLQYLSSRDNEPLQYVYVIQMAFESEYRKRSFNPETMKVKELFSGRSSRGDEVYPGDRMIKKEDAVCIQLHKVKLDCQEINKWVNKVAYTMAIYYPENFAISYVATETPNQINLDSDSDD
ncbi:MAG: Z1 domain-containing protein [Rikenellaceae bacterium]|nr:Z1 domain-containing protein [Rikenellaceae bacterium]